MRDAELIEALSQTVERLEQQVTSLSETVEKHEMALDEQEVARVVASEVTDTLDEEYRANVDRQLRVLQSARARTSRDISELLETPALTRAVDGLALTVEPDGSQALRNLDRVLHRFRPILAAASLDQGYRNTVVFTKGGWFYFATGATTFSYAELADDFTELTFTDVTKPYVVAVLDRSGGTLSLEQRSNLPTSTDERLVATVALAEVGGIVAVDQITRHQLSDIDESGASSSGGGGVYCCCDTCADLLGDEYVIAYSGFRGIPGSLAELNNDPIYRGTIGDIAFPGIHPCKFIAVSSVSGHPIPTSLPSIAPEYEPRQADLLGGLELTAWSVQIHVGSHYENFFGPTNPCDPAGVYTSGFNGGPALPGGITFGTFSMTRIV